MKKRTLYFTCVASYLTGWVVAHATYNRLRKYILTEQTDDAGDTFAEQVAFKVAELVTVGQGPYPRADGDNTVLGPEVFIDRDDEVISYRGVNYYRNYHRAGAEARPLPPTRL